MQQRRRRWPWFGGSQAEEQQEHTNTDEPSAEEGAAEGIGDQLWQPLLPELPDAPHEEPAELQLQTKAIEILAAIETGSAEIPLLPDHSMAGDHQSSAAYSTSDEHLWDELCRIEHLVAAQTVRWRRTLGENKHERLWGMVHVTAAEVDVYLNNVCQLPDDLPHEVIQEMQPYLNRVDLQQLKITQRLERWQQLDANLRPELRTPRLSKLFELSELERDILLVCLLPELDGRYRRLYGYLQDDASRSRPTIELVLQILRPRLPSLRAGRDAFDTRSTLLRNRLLDLETQSDEPLPMRPLRIDDRIAGYLLGSDMQDGRLEGVLSQAKPFEADWQAIIAPAEHIARLGSVADWWTAMRGKSQSGMTIYLYGIYGSGRQLAARAICTRAKTLLLRADLAAAMRSPHGFERIIDLCYREAQLRNAALFWSGCEQLLEAEGQAHRWDYLILAAERFNGLSFLASEIAWDPAGHFRERPFARIALMVPNYELRSKIWQRYLGQAQPILATAQVQDNLIAQLANAFQFTEGQIVDAITTAEELARQRDPFQPQSTADDLFEGCRRQSSRHLNSFAQRIAPGTDMTFNDLILPQANRRQLEELRERIHNRGRVYTDLGFERRLSLGKGVIALFTGSSGTGKTLAATLIASEQRVDLYKVDLSAVVSKYIGETEKNLNRVFAEAEDSNAIIFFDEADALFGKRGKVEEARDRWANIEVNYLLQRLEAYEGVVILATNLRQNIDDAFLRRIHVSVDFPFPDAQARASIWRGMFPAGVEPPPAEQLSRLTERFSLSGGSIRNIVLDATFRALARQASQGEQAKTMVTLRDLVLGTAREYQKQGKPLTAGEFGEQFYEWIEEDILLTPAPDQRQRLRLWHEAFPPDVVSPPRDQVSALAERFVLRPQAIRTIVASAMSSAASADEYDALGRVTLSQQHLACAIADEYRGQGRPITQAEFGDIFSLVPTFS